MLSIRAALAGGIAVALLGLRIHRVRSVRNRRLREMEASYRHLAGREEEVTYQEATDILLVSTVWVS